jgi:hypothetical protein
MSDVQQNSPPQVPIGAGAGPGQVIAFAKIGFGLLQRVLSERNITAGVRLL